ncbi:DUF1800 domain-containing protein [Tabrizicola sp.]|uniref:DUF1800 domain-containing protein n=1 Tax=Tabrizicola sp. TaxID=2005166 RepID=UPI003F33429B
MMITRRMFHTRLLAAFAAASVPLPKMAEAALAADDDLWLNRLTFGANASSRAAIAGLGREAWLEAQLAMGPTDAALEARLAAARLRIWYPAGSDELGRSWSAMDELRPLGTLGADPAELIRLLAWDPVVGMDYSERARPASEVIAASLIRAVHAEAQLREVMTQFWHNHFSVNSTKDETTAALFPVHDRMLRGHAFGNFRAMLGDVARSPAMLYYLNNADSRASPANENYARELLELHTLGARNYLNDRYDAWRDVPGAAEGLAEGYLDLDVYEVARAFTGWSVGDGRWLSEGEEAPKTGQFYYISQWHDPYQKRILGREFAPNRGPMEDGDEVLDMLARHPKTAQYVCGKIARRFIADDPDDGLVDRLVQVFLAEADAPDQIAKVIRTLVLSPEFEAPPTKLRRPFELLAALYRASGAEVTGTENAYQWQLSRAGWRQHEYGPPTGHPDKAAAWTGASTLNRLVDLALYAHDDWFGAVSIDLAAVTDGEAVGDFIARQTSALVPARGADLARELAEVTGDDLAAPASDLSPENRQGLATTAIAFAALTPEFLLR